MEFEYEENPTEDRHVEDHCRLVLKKEEVGGEPKVEVPEVPEEPEEHLDHLDDHEFQVSLYF